MGQYGKAVDSGGAKTAPETIQKIIAAQYSNTSVNPIIGGGVVTGLGTLAFHVSAGVGVCTTSAGAVQVTWDDTQTALITPPSSGTATWVVYVNVDGSVLVGVTPISDPHITLATYSVPSGTTSTTSLTNTWNTNYALPYGARLPRLAYWQENAGGGQAAATQYAAGLNFYVPTDRTIQVSIRQELYSKPTDNADLGAGSVLWTVNLDSGAQVAKVELPVDRRRFVQPFDWVIDVQKGTHTVTVNRANLWPGGTFVVYHFGAVDGYVPGSYSVYDLGVTQ